MNCSTLGLPVHHQLPELAQTQSIELVMPSNHIILCRPLLLPPSVFPSIRAFPSNLHIIQWEVLSGSRNTVEGKRGADKSPLTIVAMIWGVDSAFFKFKLFIQYQNKKINLSQPPSSYSDCLSAAFLNFVPRKLNQEKDVSCMVLVFGVRSVVWHSSE